MRKTYFAAAPAIYEDAGADQAAWVKAPAAAPLMCNQPDPSPQPTGLLDVRGNPIYSVSESDPIGFVLRH